MVAMTTPSIYGIADLSQYLQSAGRARAGRPSPPKLLRKIISQAGLSIPDKEFF
jgi:hypothetical protein